MSKRNNGKEIIEGLDELKAWRQGKVSTKLKMTRGSGNVFLDIGFAPDEVNNLMLRSQLMSRVREAAQGATQREAAKLLGITQPRLNDLLRGKIDKFSLMRWSACRVTPVGVSS